MKIQFDYASASSASPAWVWGLLAVSLVTAGAASWQYLQLQQVRAGLELRAQQYSDRPVAPRVASLPPEVRAEMQARSHQANLVLAELGQPWPALFTQLEKNVASDIALLAIRPDAAKGRLRILGEARDMEDVLDFIRRLGASGVLADVVLEEHEVVEADQQKPVRFALSARWGG